MILFPKVIEKYKLKDGKIYWHKLYFDLMRGPLTRYSPPGGDYNYAYYILHPVRYAHDLYDQARWFIQRGYRGYSDRDVWSVDQFLTSIMPNMLRQLKKTTHGYPLGIGPKRWDRKLEQMAEGFDMARRIQELDFDFKDKNASRKLEREFHKRMDLFNRHFFSLWD